LQVIYKICIVHPISLPPNIYNFLPCKTHHVVGYPINLPPDNIYFWPARVLTFFRLMTLPPDIITFRLTRLITLLAARQGCRPISSFFIGMQDSARFWPPDNIGARCVSLARLNKLMAARHALPDNESVGLCLARLNELLFIRCRCRPILKLFALQNSSRCLQRDYIAASYH
jgi:hypothetical protein